MACDGHDVFLSHSGSEDGGLVKMVLDFVRRELDGLQPPRQRTFLDEHSLSHGPADVAVERALRNCAVGASPAPRCMCRFMSWCRSLQHTCCCLTT